MSWFDTWRENIMYWAWKRQELQNNKKYCLQHRLQCKETRALRDPSWISPTSWINFLCLPEPRMSNFFFCFLDRIYCTSSEQRFGCWKSKLLFCNGVSPHLLWIAEQQLLGCVQAFVLLSALCMKRHTVGVLGWWSSQYCCSNIKSQTDHILASF